jgi:hypothetical protein
MPIRSPATGRLSHYCSSHSVRAYPSFEPMTSFVSAKITLCGTHALCPTGVRPGTHLVFQDRTDW